MKRSYTALAVLLWSGTLPAQSITPGGGGSAVNLTGPITSVGAATSIASQTGSGTTFVVDTSPTLVTPTIGVATATSVNKVAVTAPATSATLTIADGKTLTSSNTLTLAGTDGSTLNVGTGGTLGTAATKNTGNSAGTLCLLNTSCTFSGTTGNTAITANNGGNYGLVITGGTNASAINLDYSSAGIIQVRSGFQISNSSSASGSIFELDPQALYVGSAGFTTVSSWGVPASGTWRSGYADAAAPVAQSLIVQSVVAGTSNTAGALWKFQDSAGTGTGASGGFEWDTHPAGSTGTAQNAAVSKMTLSSAGALNNTGSITGAGIVSGASNNIQWTGRGIFTSTTTGNVQHGAADAAAPVAQTITFQNVVAGTADTAGQNATLTGSLSTGSGASGDLIFRTGGTGAGSTVQNSAATALTIKGATQLVQFTAITSDATHTDSTACLDTTTKALYSGSGTLGICLGTSSARFKHDIAPLGAGLPEIMQLRPVSYKLNADHGDPNKTLYGFTAEQMQPVLPKLVGLDDKGLPNSADYVGLIPVLVRAVQQQQAEIDALKKELSARPVLTAVPGTAECQPHIACATFEWSPLAARQ